MPDSTLNGLFQLLTCVRDVPRGTARNQILAALQPDKLKVDFQVRDGPGGRVHWQAWERVFTLTPQDGHLIVEPRCALDHPWDAYSFTIANGSVIGALWPVQASPSNPSPSEAPLVHPLQASAFVLGGPDCAQPTLRTRTTAPKDWFDDVKERYPRAPGESRPKYADRLYEAMQAAYAAGTVTKLWAKKTLLRHLFKDSKDS